MRQPTHNAGGVWIAGLGAVSPVGVGARAFWKALFEAPAEPGRGVVQGLPADGKSWAHGYAVQDFAIGADSRFDWFALHAAEEALQDGAARGACLRDVRVGLAIGTGAGDTQTAECLRSNRREAHFNQCNPYACAVEWPRRLSRPIDGPSFVIANACSAGLYALAHAADLIRDDMADAMLVVGVEVLSRVTQAGFQRMTALDPDRCRPFDAERHGTVLGEGAAALLLISDRIIQPQAHTRFYASLAGAGLSCDAHHPTAPQPQGRDIRVAVERALRQDDSVQVVVPHGTGTPMNDRIESEMLESVFGERIADLAVMPIKSHIGHGAGASGTFSALAAALALESRQAPPVTHIRHPDPHVPLTFSALPAPLTSGTALRALVNAYGFGGNNVSLLLERSAA